MPMYKLMIVDDEMLIREGLSQSIDWESIGFSVCCTAASGEEAYALIVAHQPDVLITDICMANMGGISLMKKLRKNGFTLPVVIISGYDDFKYAQQAIKYGAVEYLLKPINEADLRSLFISIHKRLDSGKYNSVDSAGGGVGRISAAEKNALQRSVMLMYLEGQTTSVDALLPLLEPGFLQQDRICSLAILSAKPSVLNALKRASSHNDWGCKFWAFLRHDILILLFFSAGGDVEPVLASFLQAQSARNDSAYCLLESGTFGNLPGLYRQIMATPYRFFYLTPWQISSLAGAACSDSDFPLPAAQALLDQIKDGDLDGFHSSVTALMAALRQKQPNPDMTAIRLSELYTQLAALLRKHSRSIQAVSFQELYCALCDCPNAVRFTAVFQKQMAALASSAGQAELALPSVIAGIQSFIDAHYAEDLSLSYLAQKFYLSQAYLSVLFSKSMGITFSDYLEKVRMENAAALLRTSHRNISQISEAVGYKSSRYFCRMFKKYYDCTPTEYRRQSLEEPL